MPSVLNRNEVKLLFVHMDWQKTSIHYRLEDDEPNNHHFEGWNPKKQKKRALRTRIFFLHIEFEYKYEMHSPKWQRNGKKCGHTSSATFNLMRACRNRIHEFSSKNSAFVFLFSRRVSCECVCERSKTVIIVSEPKTFIRACTQTAKLIHHNYGVAITVARWREYIRKSRRLNTQPKYYGFFFMVFALFRWIEYIRSPFACDNREVREYSNNNKQQQ